MNKIEKNHTSTLDLSGEPAKSYNILRVIWNCVNKPCEFLCRKAHILTVSKKFSTENSKIGKKIRKSIRLNKSAKSKGYAVFLSDEDKR